MIITSTSLLSDMIVTALLHYGDEWKRILESLDFWVEIVGNPNEVRKRITSRTHLAELNLYD